ncbi:DUF3168 domain-containing protein [Henriciella barbarensis]|uniref:DUF3168 domain-containing protein n=1 Tax=Henriciella barbarensis TaxID=86342 RepID=A0A399QQD3_9PROT|nr:DUF3168 domain-containing protein [Henriciella barbarensis]RIJ20385.1 DUF3168 domain-containing protein [Henriciella barbarensis]
MTTAPMQAGAEKALQLSLLNALRSDPNIQAFLGNPARIFDGESDQPIFPCVELERHDVRPNGSAGHAGSTHTLTFGLRARAGGRAEAMRILGELRRVIDAFAFSSEGLRSVLSQTVYCDVMRTPDLREFRGVIRARIILDEVVA